MPFRADVISYFAPFVVDALRQSTGLDDETIAGSLTPTPSPDLGDLAFPCFALSKKLRKPPQAIAAELAAAMDIAANHTAKGPTEAEREAPIAEVAATGPYLNFRLNRPASAAVLLKDILTADERWGDSERGSGRTVCIDYCSPNVAKPMHLGHLRSTVIGHSIARIHQALGYRVVGINFLGDYGTQFGKLVYAWKEWGDPKALESDPIGELLSLYVRFHREAKAKPELEDAGRAWFRRLEEGDPEAREIWGWIRDMSLKGFARTLSVLDVEFDAIEGEAFYADKMKAVADRLQAAGLLEWSEGAQVVPMGDDMPPCLILKKDGATLYATRDLAAALYRRRTYRPDKSLYVVDMGQSLHFRQVFRVLELLGEDWVSSLRHVPFGVMRFEGRRLRTREGDVIYLEDVLRQAVSAARERLDAKSPGMEGAEAVAEAIGVGAVVFNDLKHHREQNIDYDPEEAVSFDGETGPYLQYAHARCVNIIKKSGANVGRIGACDHRCLSGGPEWGLISELAKFPNAIELAAQECTPHVVARCVLDVAKAFNYFYHQCPVNRAEPDVKAARLALVAATAVTLRKGLWLLGVKAPPMRED